MTISQTFSAPRLELQDSVRQEREIIILPPLTGNKSLYSKGRMVILDARAVKVILFLFSTPVVEICSGVALFKICSKPLPVGLENLVARKKSVLGKLLVTSQISGTKLWNLAYCAKQIQKYKYTNTRTIPLY